MHVVYTAKDLMDFEQGIADDFLAKRIHAPIHLQGGCEDKLIRVFQEYVAPEDWLCCTWRSHLHCLLKGVPPEKLRKAIHAGRSIALCFSEYKIISSAIVGGMAPIAVGLAMGIKRKREQYRRKVVCFIGDMAWETGIVQESVKYARWHNLPLLWVLEDNGKSVETPTATVWGGTCWQPAKDVIRYEYVNTWPHCGVGKHVSF